MDDSIAKLSDSISQHAATVLINLKIPEFSGAPQQEVSKFIKDFKAATLTLNDELKCLALQRAIVGPARVWAKTNIKQELAEGNWEAAKFKLRKRFSLPGEDLRLSEKLAKMQYDSNDMSLSSYVETYADLFKKVQPNSSDRDVIRGMRLNLSPEILKHLNIISATWTTLTSLREFIVLITRVERDILPFESKSKPDTDANLTAMVSAIKELKEIVSTQKQPHQIQSQNTEIVAAIANRAPAYVQPDNKRPFPGDHYEQQNGNFKKQFNWPRAPANAGGQQVGNQSELQRRYEAKFGKVPYPCRTCCGLHFHRHCPLNIQDLN